MSTIHLQFALASQDVGQIQPFIVTKKDLCTMYRSPRLAQRMISAGWIMTARPGRPGRATLYDFESAKAAYARLKNGEEPPLLAWESKRGPTP